MLKPFVSIWYNGMQNLAERWVKVIECQEKYIVDWIMILCLKHFIQKKKKWKLSYQSKNEWNQINSLKINT